MVGATHGKWNFKRRAESFMIGSEPRKLNLWIACQALAAEAQIECYLSLKWHDLLKGADTTPSVADCHRAG
jgi:hypothetical protein